MEDYFNVFVRHCVEYSPDMRADDSGIMTQS